MTDAPRALVSGAAGGIGRALAEGFLAAGYEVTGVDREAQGWSAPGFRYATLDLTDNEAVAAFGAGLDSARCAGQCRGHHPARGGVRTAHLRAGAST